MSSRKRIRRYRINKAMNPTLKEYKRVCWLYYNFRLLEADPTVDVMDWNVIQWLIGGGDDEI